MDITKIKGNIGIIDNDLLERPLHNFPNFKTYENEKHNQIKLNFNSKINM